jgi:hypothetical protein
VHRIPTIGTGQGQHLDHPAFVSGTRASTSPVTCIDFTCHESGRAAPGFTTRSNTSGDPDSLRILRRSRHRGAAPASRCEARMRLWRRTRQTEMSAFAQGPNVRAGCLAIPSARPASLAIVSAAPASAFPLRCCPDRQELRFQVATTVSPDSRFWSYCYTRRRLWNWSKSER